MASLLAGQPRSPHVAVKPPYGPDQGLRAPCGAAGLTAPPRLPDPAAKEGGGRTATPPPPTALPRVHVTCHLPGRVCPAQEWYLALRPPTQTRGVRVFAPYNALKVPNS